MPLWSWRTSPDESVEVLRPGNDFVRSVSGPHSGLEKTQANVLRWLPLAVKYGAKHGVPPSWILGTMYAESGGDPKAENSCCVGLMAISYRVHGKTREAMLDPEQNIDYGTSLLASSRKRGYDLPASASIHVAGGGKTGTPHAGTCCSAMCKPTCKRDKNDRLICVTHPDFPGGSPWGMCEHMFRKTQGDDAVGYIDRVVRANNSFIDLMGQRRPPGAPPPEIATAAPRVGPLLLGVALAGAATIMAGRKGWI